MGYVLASLRTWRRTNRRIAEDRLPCSRVPSIRVTNSAVVIFSVSAIFFSSVQKASSRVILVLCPPTTMERFFTIGDDRWH